MAESWGIKIVLVIIIGVALTFALLQWNSTVAGYDPAKAIEDIGIATDEGTIGDGGTCPDGTCDTGETYDTCPEDCPYGSGGENFLELSLSDIGCSIANVIYDDYTLYGKNDDKRKSEISSGGYGSFDKGGTCIKYEAGTEAKYCLIPFDDSSRVKKIKLSSDNTILTDLTDDSSCYDCTNLDEGCITNDLKNRKVGNTLNSFCGGTFDATYDDGVKWENNNVYSYNNWCTDCKCGNSDYMGVRTQKTSVNTEIEIKNEEFVREVVPEYDREYYTYTYWDTRNPTWDNDKGNDHWTYFVLNIEPTDDSIITYTETTLLSKIKNELGIPVNQEPRENLGGLFEPNLRKVVDTYFTISEDYISLADLISKMQTYDYGMDKEIGDYDYTVKRIPEGCNPSNKNDIRSCLKLTSYKPGSGGDAGQQDDRYIFIQNIPDVDQDALKKDTKYRLTITKYEWKTANSLTYYDYGVVISKVVIQTTTPTCSCGALVCQPPKRALCEPIDGQCCAIY
ncbi:MAG: hypothetical protein PHU12_02920 [Candidatus Aenigmarchaeota archaeon]|nr:hypothetical protein [Candidatus Aenigmarchaeota archaeon]